MKTSNPRRSGGISSRLLVPVVCAALLSSCGSRVDEPDTVAAERPVSAGAAAVGPGAPAIGQAAVPSGAGVPAPNLTSGAAVSPGDAASGTAGGAAARGPGAAPTGADPARSAARAADPELSASGTCTKAGAPVVIGQVGTFSGLVGANFAGAQKTPYVWVNYMNARGGLNCHPIRFIQIDDQSNPQIAQQAVERLAGKEGAAALFAAFSPLSIVGLISGVTKAQIPVIGGEQAGPEWTSTKLLYPVGGTSRAMTAGSAKQAADFGRKNLAVFYCVETSQCGTNFYDTLVKDGFTEQAGMKVVTSSSISITQPDFTAQCQSAKSAGADAIAWGLDRAGVQRAAKSCASLGYFPTLPLISLQGAFDQKDANIRKSGVFLSAPVFPYVQNSSPAEKLFQDAMKKYAPDAVVDAPAAIVWADGMMVAKLAGLMPAETRDRPLTKADFLAATAKVKGETLGGLIPPTTWTQQGPQRENLCFYPLAFTDGTFRAPAGSKHTCLKDPKA